MMSSMIGLYKAKKIKITKSHKLKEMPKKYHNQLWKIYG